MRRSTRFAADSTPLRSLGARLLWSAEDAQRPRVPKLALYQHYLGRKYLWTYTPDVSTGVVAVLRTFRFPSCCDVLDQPNGTILSSQRTTADLLAFQRS